jgi:hypothetical protein
MEIVQNLHAEDYARRLEFIAPFNIKFHTITF